MWRARTCAGNAAAASFQNAVLSMLQSFRFEQSPHGTHCAAQELRHLSGTHGACFTLERVQFRCRRVLLQVAVFHEFNVGPQHRDYKR